MKQRPINLKAWEVRAILDRRKTQFRRIFKFRETNQPPSCPDKFDPKAVTQHCPFGTPGDRLWVRECHYVSLPPYYENEGAVEYRADYCDELAREIPWKSSIHMPRWASRFDLELVSVRVERLNEISEEDAWDEGCPGQRDGIATDSYHWFRHMWQSDDSPESWDENPWVWVVEFRRV